MSLAVLPQLVQNSLFKYTILRFNAQFLVFNTKFIMYLLHPTHLQLDARHQHRPGHAVGPDARDVRTVKIRS